MSSAVPRAREEEWSAPRSRAIRLFPADAVECGWSRDVAGQLFAARFPGRSSVTVAEFAAIRSDGDPLAAQIGDEMLAYRIERERMAAAYAPIRLTRANLKRLGLDPATVGALRALAGELGWRLRDDEEGETVPIDDLLPFYRRPVVRTVLDRKMAQCGMR